MSGSEFMRDQKQPASQLVPAGEYAKLRELRNECLVEFPIITARIAETIRSRATRGGPFAEIADELQRYGLHLKRLAEEAR